MDKTREERIKELKALRGELLAYKAAQEENEGNGNARCDQTIPCNYRT